MTLTTQPATNNTYSFNPPKEYQHDPRSAIMTLATGYYVQDDDEQLYIVYSLRYGHGQLIECSTDGTPLKTIPDVEIPIETLRTYKQYRSWPPKPRGRPPTANHKPNASNLRVKLQAQLDRGVDLAQAIVNTESTPTTAYTALHYIRPGELPPAIVSIGDFVYIYQAMRPRKCRILMAYTQPALTWRSH